MAERSIATQQEEQKVSGMQFQALNVGHKVSSGDLQLIQEENWEERKRSDSFADRQDNNLLVEFRVQTDEAAVQSLNHSG